MWAKFEKRPRLGTRATVTENAPRRNCLHPAAGYFAHIHIRLRRASLIKPDAGGLNSDPAGERLYRNMAASMGISARGFSWRKFAFALSYYRPAFLLVPNLESLRPLL